MVDQVEVDVKVNVEDGDLGKLGKKIKDATKDIEGMGKNTPGLNNLKQATEEVPRNIRKIGRDGKSAFDNLTKAEQDAAIKFNMLDKSSQNLLHQLSTIGRNGLPGMGTSITQAKQKFAELNNVTNTWKGSLDYSKSKLQLVGTETNSLKGKIQLVGTTIQTYFTNKWDMVKNKVRSVGNFIKSSLKSALNAAGQGVRKLGDAFSGLGGVVSSVMGGIGMASIGEMTVGLAMNRERMTALTSATMGGTKAGKQFVGVMDKLTDSSLVSLDDLGQAMSTIKMSTGMSNKELQSFTTTVNDVGQRAILMGRTGDEAIGLMQAAGKGLNGEFDMLKANFGISKEKLQDLGWSGAATDVKGYQKALDAALEKGGSMEGMMNTTTGKLETLKKKFRVAGRQIGEEFTPYIDAGLSKLLELNDEFPNLFKGVIGAAGALSGFATVAPSISPMIDIFDSLGDGVGTFNKKIGGGKAIKTFFKELKGGKGIIGSLSASFTVLAGAEWASLWPILAIIAAIAAIGVAFYEVGKYLGWWKDLGTMFDSVKAGIQRMWSAFINHPDVQATLGAIKAAWDWLVKGFQAIYPYLQQIWDYIFPETAGESVDAVHGAILVIGKIWEVLSIPIRTVITTLQWLWNTFNELYVALQPVINFLASILVPIWAVISTNIMTAINSVIALINIFNAFLEGQISLPDALSAAWSIIGNLFNTTMSNIIGLARSFGTRLLNYIRQVASDFVNKFINGLAGLGSAFTSALRAPWDALVKWGSNMLNKAEEFVRGIANKINQITGLIPGSSGFSAGFEISGTPPSSGFSGASRTPTPVSLNAGNTLNNTISKQTSNNNTSTTNNNFNFKGIIEKDAATFIVDAVNDNIRKQNLIRGRV